MFDRIGQSPGGSMDGDTDIQRLVVGDGLPTTTTSLDDSELQEHADILCPQAYFLIDERQGSATINFEPALSARYVHVKLLSGQAFDNYSGRCERDNIDIQAILLYGYGRRIFPRVDVR